MEKKLATNLTLDRNPSVINIQAIKPLLSLRKIDEDSNDIPNGNVFKNQPKKSLNNDTEKKSSVADQDDDKTSNFTKYGGVPLKSISRSS